MRVVTVIPPYTIPTSLPITRTLIILADPSKLTTRERNGLGITRQLPDGIGKAMDLLKADKKLKARIGEACMAKYIIMKKAEIAALEKKASVREWKIGRAHV